MRGLLSLLLLVPALAGCLADDLDGPAAVDRARAAIGTPIEAEHDHLDPMLHTASANVEFLSWSTLDIELGRNGFANFVLWEGDGERLAFVAVDGDHDGGFVVADVSDPSNVQVLGAYRVPGNSFQEVRVTPDGRFAVLNVQDLPGADPTELDERVNGDGTYCPVCIHVVDVQDRTAPVLSSLTPVELLGTHNMDFHEQDGALLLYYVGQPILGYEFPQSTPGNHVWIAQFMDTGGRGTLLPLSSFQHVTAQDTGRSFPHDVLVQTHPVTGQDIAYVSHWDGGAITFDVTDPMQPVELDVAADYAPSDALAIHWFWQEEWTRADGRVIAWSAPEIGVLGTGTGVVRGYDVTDPANILQVGTWELPGAGKDGVFIPDRYVLSPHTVLVDPETLVAAVAHYHAGVWLLDVSDPSDPKHVGFFQPVGNPEAPYHGPLWWKKPNFSPDGYGPNVYMARWDDRGDETVLWVSDRGTGLYALRYTGPANVLD